MTAKSCALLSVEDDIKCLISNQELQKERKVQKFILKRQEDFISKSMN